MKKASSPPIIVKNAVSVRSDGTGKSEERNGQKTI